MFDRDLGIIIACDISTKEELSALVQCGERNIVVVGYKIGFALGLRFGLRNVVDIIRSNSSRPIIYDHQKAGTDIPRMGVLFAQCCKEAGVNGIIVFPQAGPETMKSFIEAIHEVGATPIIGGVMTHPAFLRCEGGYIDDSAPSEIYKKSAEIGVEHFILPGNRPEIVRKYVYEISEFKKCINVLMPGIGTQGGKVDEAFRAAGKNRSYAIIGSAIYKAPDMERALDEISDMVLKYRREKV